MRAEDQFHVGIVVDDFEGTQEALSALFGYEWCGEIGGPVPVLLPTGRVTLDMGLSYSKTSPRLELVRTIPGSLWVPAAGSGIHHLGYWSDDLTADGAELSRRGFAAEATGLRPDGEPLWAYHRHPDGPRIELVSRTVQPLMEQYWATGGIT